ncbi:HD domain-containing protein [Steroidobacter agaridevorans]|uniref:HD domain-containing protein n=1 Tax=Steroidobacter agaridevorans TaxID=2695856 RepID=UPI00132B9462|nr:HD domain-containing protein [Steroidobacter agaridevorans]GFE86449.1 hypothetical protein GCM10011488_14030 [Steroidobacter agaridevorans]
MKTAKPLIHRDQIHRDTTFDPLSVALLNSAPLQRLGRVYQLGYAHLIFRGGTHTRLSHVMGASHVATQLVLSLKENYASSNLQFCPQQAIAPQSFLPFSVPAKQNKERREQTRLDNRWSFVLHVCRWAALLHDIGHIPMGHTLEDEYEQIYPRHDDFRNPRLRSLWVGTEAQPSEIRAILEDDALYPPSFAKLGISSVDVFDTVLLICCYKEDRRRSMSFEQLLNEEIAEGAQADPVSTPHECDVSFCRLLCETYRRQCGPNGRGAFRVFMADLVTNTICADYLDYMQRDPYNVGLDVLSDPRVAGRFYIGNHPLWGKRMALSLVDRSGKSRLDTASGVFELVRQRFRFAETIYYHKTKVAASAMFVKALGLLESPPEASGLLNPSVELGDVEALTSKLMDAPRTLPKLREQHLPFNLLSPDIGDDSIHLFLQQMAWKQIEEALPRKTSEPDQSRALVKDALVAISLLSGIVRRKLYKQCFSMDATLTKEALWIPTTDEHSLVTLITQLRERHAHRSLIEEAMCSAAGVNPGSFIIYVPERKSQAKGVETFAISGEGVITLGDHPHLSKKMLELNEDYRNLWRMLIFVHPEVCKDNIGTSQAVDALILELRNMVDEGVDTAPDYLSRPRVEQAIQEGSRIVYIPRSQRAAAQRLTSLLKCADREGTPICAPLQEVRELAARRSKTIDSDAHAYCAFIATWLPTNAGKLESWAQTAVEELIDGELHKQMSSERVFGADGGVGDSNDAQIAGILHRIAADLKRRHNGQLSHDTQIAMPTV